MNCRREVSALAQDSSYVGEEGEKRGAPLPPVVPLGQPQQVDLPYVPCLSVHYLIACQYLSQDMDCKMSKDQGIFVFLSI